MFIVSAVSHRTNAKKAILHFNTQNLIILNISHKRGNPTQENKIR